jgi:hypothetical protein
MQDLASEMLNQFLSDSCDSLPVAARFRSSVLFRSVATQSGRLRPQVLQPRLKMRSEA